MSDSMRTMVDRMVGAVRDTSSARSRRSARLDAIESAGLTQEAIDATKALQRALEATGPAATRRQVDRHAEHLARLETRGTRREARLDALERDNAELKRRVAELERSRAEEAAR
jgi:small-conductance mechanosensitive channel